MGKSFKSVIAVAAILLIIVLISVGCGGSPTPTQTAADFYKGKSIDFYIFSAAGGGHDAISRIYAEGLAKYTEAAVVPVNKPGGGFMLSPIYVATTTKPDGLSISAAEVVTSQLGQVLGMEGMENVDITKWNWLCSMRGLAQIVFVKKDSPYNSLADLIKTNNTFKHNVPSLASNNGIFGLMVMRNVLKKENFKVYAAVEGSAEQAAAVIRGEFDGAALPSNRVVAYTKDIKPIICLGLERDPLLPDVPTLSESLAAAGVTLDDDGKFWVNVINATSKSLTAVMTGPDVPKDRIDFLSMALEKAGKDPELLAKAEKANLGMKWISGKEIYQDITEFVKMSPERVAALKNQIKISQNQ